MTLADLLREHHAAYDELDRRQEFGPSREPQHVEQDRRLEAYIAGLEEEIDRRQRAGGYEVVEGLRLGR